MLMFMDYRLKNEFGTNLLRIYKDKLACLKFKIYGLTSSEDKDTVKKYTDFGVQDVIFKPLKAEDVKKILNTESEFVKNVNYNNNIIKNKNNDNNSFYTQTKYGVNSSNHNSNHNSNNNQNNLKNKNKIQNNTPLTNSINSNIEKLKSNGIRNQNDKNNIDNDLINDMNDKDINNNESISQVQILESKNSINNATLFKPVGNKLRKHEYNHFDKDTEKDED